MTALVHQVMGTAVTTASGLKQCISSDVLGNTELWQEEETYCASVDSVDTLQLCAHDTYEISSIPSAEVNKEI